MPGTLAIMVPVIPVTSVASSIAEAVSISSVVTYICCLPM
jgi:hypothetical protein